MITPYYIAGLKGDGTVLGKSGGLTDHMDIESFSEQVSKWSDIKQLYEYSLSLIGLRRDGTLLATDTFWLNYYWNDNKAKDDDSDWNHIERLISSIDLLALKEDGTVLGSSHIHGSQDPEVGNKS